MRYHWGETSFIQTVFIPYSVCIMRPLPHKGLYAITDCDNLNTRHLLDYTAVILANGAVLLQYRNKTDQLPDRHTKAEKIQRLCHEFNVPLIINDDIELARTLKADGVHLGKDDMDCRKARVILGPECIIGVSCYNDIKRAMTAAYNGASYVAFGSFFPTESKRYTTQADISLLQQACRTLAVPVAAIGGITPDNGGQLIEAGVNYLAVISGLYASSDPATITRQYVNLFTQDMNQYE